MRSALNACELEIHLFCLGMRVPPDIEVSLVVNADDASMLAEPGVGHYAYEAFRRFVKIAFRPVFAHRMRPSVRG